MIRSSEATRREFCDAIAHMENAQEGGGNKFWCKRN